MLKLNKFLCHLEKLVLITLSLFLRKHQLHLLILLTLNLTLRCHCHGYKEILSGFCGTFRMLKIILIYCIVETMFYVLFIDFKKCYLYFHITSQFSSLYLCTSVYLYLSIYLYLYVNNIYVVFVHAYIIFLSLMAGFLKNSSNFQSNKMCVTDYFVFKKFAFSKKK